MNDVKTRLREIVGPNVYKFARIIGENRQNIDNYLLGRMPRGEFLKKLAEKANININWLLTGKGPKDLSAAATVNIITIDEYKKLLQNQRSARTFSLIPLVSEPIVAGDPLVINEKDIEGYVGIHETWIKPGHTYYCFRVRYNSMHPIVSEGFIVAIDLNENDPLKLEHQIVAARYDGGIILRYLNLTEKEYVLLPNNMNNTAEHKPIVIPRTTKNPIIGKVAWWWGKQK